MNIGKLLIANMSGATIAVSMQAMCKNADMELNFIGKVGTYLVGTFCGYAIANKFIDVINPILKVDHEEDEAD